MRFLSAALVHFTAFGIYSEWSTQTGRGEVSARPVGWDLAGFTPGEMATADGWDEFRGYWKGRRQNATDAKVFRGVRDVIVIGAGAGGPVVAKELAAQGLDVLVLEAGPEFTDTEQQWSRYENDASNLATGYFRVGPGDRDRPAWFRELPQASLLWQVAGVGGTTLHYYANSIRAMPGTFLGYDGPDRSAYDTDHPFPFTYDELLPYYEWVEWTLPVATGAMGTKEEVVFRGAENVGLPLNTTRTVTTAGYRPQENAILQPQGTAGRTHDPARLRYPQAQGCTFCGWCFQGCVEPRGAPRNLKAKRSTDASYVPMARHADVWADGGRPIELRADAYVTRIEHEVVGGRTRARGVTWRDVVTGDEHTEDATVVVLAGGCTESPRLWFNSGLPNPNDWVGRGYTDHAFDWVMGVFDEYTGSSKGTGSSARVDFPGHGALEHVGHPPGPAGVRVDADRPRHPRPLLQRPGAARGVGRPRRSPHRQRAEGRAVERQPAGQLRHADRRRRRTAQPGRDLARCHPTRTAPSPA